MGIQFDYLKQLVQLTKKNVTLQVRSWKMLLFTVLAPIVLIVVLKVLMVTLLNNLQRMFEIKSNVVLHPKPTEIGLLPKCWGYGGRKCVTVAYSPADAKPVIDILLADNKLTAKDAIAVDSTELLFNRTLHHPNTTGVGIAFDVDHWKQGSFVYTIMYNGSRVQTDPFTIETTGDVIPSLQLSIDNAILKYKLKGVQETILNKLNGLLGNRLINIQLRSLPTPPREIHLDPQTVTTKQLEGFLLYSLGAFFFQFSFVIFWIALLYYIVSEKALNLRFAMTIMGMKNASWWHSWIFSSVVQMSIAILGVYLVGLACKIRIFLKANPLIVLSILLSFAISMMSLAILLSTITTSVRAALLIAFIINGVAFFTGMITSNGLIIYFIYMKAPWLPYVFILFSPFHFSKCIADLVTVTYGFNPLSPNDHFGAAQFFHRLPSIFGQTTAPPTYINVLMMWVCSLVLLFIAWYADNVLPTNMNGTPRPFYFLFTPSYWGLSSKGKNLLHVSNTLLGYNNNVDSLKRSEPDQRVADHISKATEQSSDLEESDLFRVVQLEKTYNSGKVKAVQNVSFRANKGMCLALLGHNGAGKSTIISTIIGQNEPTAGTCFVFGKDTKYHITDIRKDIGVCMQDDFLNPDLTAWEHLNLFAEFKNVPDKTAEITQRLKDVGLFEVRNNTTKTFSGGMKRRLSCAIALVGSPSMVILDEPTTGLDVQSKRLIWNLVHQMKKDKLVLLTTHAMEEADKLGDLIAIMAHGKLKCIGNSLQLKTQFGAGFNIQVTTNVQQHTVDLEESHEVDEQLAQQLRPDLHEQLQEKAQIVKNIVLKYVPHAEELSIQANSLMYKLPNTVMKDLVPLVQAIEEISISRVGQENAVVKSFHLSQSTLEEVYLSVTKQANFGVRPQQ